MLLRATRHLRGDPGFPRRRKVPVLSYHASKTLSSALVNHLATATHVRSTPSTVVQRSGSFVGGVASHSNRRGGLNSIVNSDPRMSSTLPRVVRRTKETRQEDGAKGSEKAKGRKLGSQQERDKGREWDECVCQGSWEKYNAPLVERGWLLTFASKIRTMVKFDTCLYKANGEDCEGAKLWQFIGIFSRTHDARMESRQSSTEEAPTEEKIICLQPVRRRSTLAKP